MTKLLIKALEAAVLQDSNEQKKFQEKVIGRELADFEQRTGQKYMIEGSDGKMGVARELLLTEAIEGTNLVQTEMYSTVVEGAQPFKCVREAFNVIPMKSNALDVPYGEVGRYAPFIGEGAEFTSRTQDYNKRTITAKKFGEIPLATREMVDDSLFAIIEMEARAAGAAVENTLNQMVMAHMLDNAGNEYDINAAVAALGGAAAIREALALIAADGYHGDSVIYHPQVATYLYKDYVPIAYNPVAQDQMRTGVMPPILGCQLRENGVDVSTTSTPTASTYVWGAPNDGYIGMLVFEKQHAGFIGMRQDMFIEDYRDPLRDLLGAKVSMRAGCTYLIANSLSRVEYGGA